MNENNTEQIEEMEEQIGGEETGEGTEESQQNNQQSNTELQNTEHENGENPVTVSDGDSGNESAQPIYEIVEIDIEPIVERLDTLIEMNQEEIDIMKEELETETIWEKPLEEYTVVESFCLTFFIAILAVAIFYVVGGIIKCKI